MKEYAGLFRGEWTVLLTGLFIIASLSKGFSQGTIVFLEDFESRFAQDDWYPDNGLWPFGAPPNGPSKAFSGTNCAAVTLAGTYHPFTDSRLIGPAIDLPILSGSETLQLRYREWYSYSTYDSGTSQVSVYNSTNRQWGAWVDLRTVGGESVTWNPTRVDISTYAGERVRWGFLHVADQPRFTGENESYGWFLDDVQIWTDQLPLTFEDLEAAALPIRFYRVRTTP